MTDYGPACADDDHQDCSGQWVDGDAGAPGTCSCHQVQA